MTLALSPSQCRFAELLAAVPWLERYWDFEAGECQLDRIKDAMGVWSHGERVLAQFFVGVWRGNNELGFDLIDAASTLDPQHRAVIGTWLADPFWP